MFQDLDAMIEARNADEWEKLNEEPQMDVEEVCYELCEVIDSLTDAFKSLGDAAKLAKGTPFEDRILSIFNDMEPMKVDAENLIKKLRKEVKSA